MYRNTTMDVEEANERIVKRQKITKDKNILIEPAEVPAYFEVEDFKLRRYTRDPNRNKKVWTTKDFLPAKPQGVQLHSQNEKFPRHSEETATAVLHFPHSSSEAPARANHNVQSNTNTATRDVNTSRTDINKGSSEDNSPIESKNMNNTSSSYNAMSNYGNSNNNIKAKRTRNTTSNTVFRYKNNLLLTIKECLAANEYVEAEGSRNSPIDITTGNGTNRALYYSPTNISMKHSASVDWEREEREGNVMEVVEDKPYEPERQCMPRVAIDIKESKAGKTKEYIWKEHFPTRRCLPAGVPGGQGGQERVPQMGMMMPVMEIDQASDSIHMDSVDSDVEFDNMFSDAESRTSSEVAKGGPRSTELKLRAHKNFEQRRRTEIKSSLNTLARTLQQQNVLTKLKSQATILDVASKHIRHLRAIQALLKGTVEELRTEIKASTRLLQEKWNAKIL